MSLNTEAYNRVEAAQKLAAKPDASIWVSANAGSGKTKVLIDRVARLLLQGAQPDSILCITYTKAAASEMQQRLFKRLGSWSVMKDSELAADLQKLESKEATFTQQQLKDARALFAKALETPGGLRIETLHAFAGRVLRRFPLEAGVPPGFKELDDIDNATLWTHAARLAFDRLKADPAKWPLFAELMSEIKGLRYDGAKKLITDNASKLKTFFARHPDPESWGFILGDVLGAPEATSEELLDSLVGSGLPKDRIGDAVLELEARGGKNDQTMASELRTILETQDLQAAYTLYRKNFYDSKNEVRTKGRYTKKFEGSLLENLFGPVDGRETQRFFSIEGQMLAAKLRERTLTLLRMAEPILSAHTYEKRIRAGLDFDDLISNTRDLLTRAGLAEWVLYKLDGGISHVLLDEAQDTSPDQWVIVNSLVSEFFSGAGSKDLIRTLFVVGDEKQSIYSFQGADTAKFQRERQSFSARDADADITGAIHLPSVEMSFRSTPQVLSFVDAVFNGPAMAGGPPFSTEAPGGADQISHQAFRNTDTGHVEVWPLEAPDEAPTNVPWDAPIDMERQVSPAAQLAERIAKWVKRRLEPGAPGIYQEGRETEPRPAHAGDILILVRSRKALFHSIIQKLKAEGLPVAGADRINILNTLAVQDVLNLIRFALLPENDLKLAEILKGPFLGLLDDDEHLFPLAYGRERTSLWERVQFRSNPDHDAARTFLAEVLKRRHLPAFEFLSWVMNTRHSAMGQTGWQMLKARFGAPAHDPLEALVSLAANMDDADSASLQTFLAAVENTDSDIKREPSGPVQEIRVMTVHGSKGLEAPIVILPDTTGVGRNDISGQMLFDENGMPCWMKKAEDDCPASAALRALQIDKARAESNRLLYVALTRAKDELIICGAWSGKPGGAGFKAGSWYELCQQTVESWTSADASTDEEGVWSLGGLPQPVVGGATAPDDSDAKPLPDWLFTPRSVRSSEQQDKLRAPSSLLPGDTPVLPPFGKDHVKRFQRGRLIHALLEILPDTPMESRRERAERFLSTCLDADEAHLMEDVINVTFSVLDAPELAPVFGPGGRPEAPVVGRGPNLPDGIIINGRVDRLRVTENEVWVIDYKTDRPPPKRAEDVALPYLAQLGAYHDVLSVTYPDKSVKCALLWTDGPHFMVLAESAMLAALKKAQETN
ncbi:double-strand break repair helicase AddA [Ponticaulis sp.]|uniref:double-strand break repair helicase AddA n=1 Tax=Ponticaulis sp. TaxID=2020902 RepID=UPI000B73B9E8|nr:double-strand break repair helicase AddA [Ponticaulis sp.]MAI91641.1 double-strand break repair helicase AddA [Ponticaulis sp.]OUX97207.1 MAG: double-strand break repair helicase AddA [Hyphomonadaceae bacterium TMED5]|tara:strand:+ start:34745 stop:38266 length:3522 start_codon:yes stop_codon:yes gene_type:complete